MWPEHSDLRQSNGPILLKSQEDITESSDEQEDMRSSVQNDELLRIHDRIGDSKQNTWSKRRTSQYHSGWLRPTSRITYH